MATATNTTDFDQAKAYLMKANPDGLSMYDHLYNVVYNIMEENPMDVAQRPENFARVSEDIKKHLYAYGDRAPLDAVAPKEDYTRVERATEATKMFAKPAANVSTTIEQPTPFTTVTTTTVVPPKAPLFRSVQQDALLWKACGVGLPDQEAFLLDQAISKLAMEKSLEDVRFFGKIFGIQGNYIVVTSKKYVEPDQTVYDEVNEMPKPPRKKVEVDIQPEPGYKGTNRISFWVCSYVSGPWTLLPDVTPQQINAARSLSKFFTGDLNAKVHAYPAFPGTERELLRAQLGRIFAATYICPGGALERVEPEDEEEEEELEEGKTRPPKPAKYIPLTKPVKDFAVGDEENGVSGLTDLEQWQHAEQHLFKTGRATKVPPKPEVEGEEDEEEKDAEEEVEEQQEEEEKEVFLPVKKDNLFAVIKMPKEPNPEGEEEDEAPPEPEPELEEGKHENDPAEELPPEEEIPDDDPLRKKILPWTSRVVNNLYKKHGVCIVRSVRWPGAYAYAGNAKSWGCVYFGRGIKKTDHAFTPTPAMQIMSEPADLMEVHDATAANEKLVLRGEELKEGDSEDEKEEEEEEKQEE